MGRRLPARQTRGYSLARPYGSCKRERRREPDYPSDRRHRPSSMGRTIPSRGTLEPRSTQIHGSSHHQSIASSHGADILCSFLRKSHAFHGGPASFPTLSRRVLQLSPVNHGLDVNEPSRPISHMQDDLIEHEDETMLESVFEMFKSATTRSDVDAEEMFMQLIGKVDSPLGYVWLDGVSVSHLSSMSLFTNATHSLERQLRRLLHFRLSY